MRVRCMIAMCFLVTACSVAVGCSGAETVGYETADAAAVAYVKALANGDAAGFAVAVGRDASDRELELARVDVFGADVDIGLDDLSAAILSDWPVEQETMVACVLRTADSPPFAQDGRIYVDIVTEQNGGRWIVKRLPIRNGP